MVDAKNPLFPALQILTIFHENFIGLAGLIGAKGIGVAQPIWS